MGGIYLEYKFIHNGQDALWNLFYRWRPVFEAWPPHERVLSAAHYWDQVRGDVHQVPGFIKHFIKHFWKQNLEWAERPLWAECGHPEAVLCSQTQVILQVKSHICIVGDHIWLELIRPYDARHNIGVHVHPGRDQQYHGQPQPRGGRGLPYIYSTSCWHAVLYCM